MPFDVGVLEELLRDIEPSDGVMHEGAVVYAHREARLIERLGAMPAPLALVAIDEVGKSKLSRITLATQAIPRASTESSQHCWNGFVVRSATAMSPPSAPWQPEAPRSINAFCRNAGSRR